MNLKAISEKLTSKKLWIAIAGSLYFGLQGDTNAVLFIVLGYLGVQGAVDFAKK